MLKRSFCLFLTVLIVSSTLTRLFYFAGYELNKDYIANVLCINKDKPQLNCHGKCFLSKKIAEAQKKQEANERQIQKDLSQQTMLITEFKIAFFCNDLLTDHPVYSQQYSLTKYTSIFHPPPFV